MTPVLKQFDLSGRTALVTGSSAGIGLALAQGLAGAGAAVVLNARHGAKLQAAAQRLHDQGATVHEMPFDVTDATAVADAVARIEAQIAPIDILVDNAGMQKRAPLQDFEMADWQPLMRTNFDSVFVVGQAVARHMIGRQRVRIINICSVQSELGRPGIAPYTASKGARWPRSPPTRASSTCSSRPAATPARWSAPSTCCVRAASSCRWVWAAR